MTFWPVGGIKVAKFVLFADTLDAGYRTPDVTQDGTTRVGTAGMGDALLKELDRLAA